MPVLRLLSHIVHIKEVEKGTPIGYPCPFHKRMKDLLTAGLPENIRILDYTHDAPGDKK